MKNFAVLSRLKLTAIIYLTLIQEAASPLSFIQSPHQDDVCVSVQPISPTTCVLLACLAV